LHAIQMAIALKDWQPDQGFVINDDEMGSS